MQRITTKINSRCVNLKTSAGEDGATFKPFVSDNGIISWTNDKGLVNPIPVNIKGIQGEKGEVNIDDLQISQDSTWSSEKINSEILNINDSIETLDNKVDNLNLLEIDDNNILSDKTWSSEKINTELAFINETQEIDFNNIIVVQTGENFNSKNGILTNLNIKGKSVLINNELNSLANQDGLILQNINSLDSKKLVFKDEDGIWKNLLSLRSINENIYDNIFYQNFEYFYNKKINEIILDGTYENITREENLDSQFTESYILIMEDALPNSNGLSSVLEFGNFEDRSCIFINSDGNIQIKRLLTDNRWTDVLTLKNFLFENNVNVLYQIIEEKIFELSNIDLISNNSFSNLQLNSVILTNISFTQVEKNNEIMYNIINRLSNIENTENSIKIIGTESIFQFDGAIGDLDDLETITKQDLVQAINELRHLINELYQN